MTAPVGSQIGEAYGVGALGTVGHGGGGGSGAGRDPANPEPPPEPTGDESSVERFPITTRRTVAMLSPVKAVTAGALAQARGETEVKTRGSSRRRRRRG